MSSHAFRFRIPFAAARRGRWSRVGAPVLFLAVLTGVAVPSRSEPAAAGVRPPEPIVETPSLLTARRGRDWNERRLRVKADSAWPEGRTPSVYGDLRDWNGFRIYTVAGLGDAKLMDRKSSRASVAAAASPFGALNPRAFEGQGGQIGVAASYIVDRGAFAIAPTAQVSYTATNGFGALPAGVVKPRGVGLEAGLRLGVFDPGKTVFFYGKMALVGQQFTVARNAFAGSSEADAIRFGYQLGLGAEARLTERMSVLAEYAFERFPSVKTNLNRGRLGLGYRF